MTQDRPLLGIGLMLGFCMIAPLSDAIAKVLGALVPIGLLVMVRFGTQALVLIPMVWATGRPWRMSRRIWWLVVLRTLLHITGIGAMVTALKFLPLADAVAIAFVMPFIMLLLGHFMLGEEVGMRRIAACAVGFVGTLLVIEPSFDTVGLPALLPLVVAVTFSLFMIVTRQIAKETDPISLQAVSGVIAIVVMVPALVLGTRAGLDQLRLVMPDLYETSLLLTIGLLGTFAHLLMTWSLRYAPSATLAPMQYLEIPIATMMGWVFFRDLPTGKAAIGICITIAAGLYIVMRERASQAQQRSVPG